MPAESRVTHLGTLQDGRSLVRALCEVSPFDDAASKARWIHVMPFGPFIEARDGRAFQVENVQAVLASTELPLLVDWEHQSAAMFGGTSRAAGWIEELAVEDGFANRFPSKGLWGRVEWTEEGARDVAAKAFRFLSPVLLIDKETRNVETLLSVALTNTPALHLEGIAADAYCQKFSARFGQEKGNQTMKKETLIALCACLGLQPEAADEAVLDAAKSLAARVQSGTADKELCARLTTDVAKLTAENTELKTKLSEHEKASFAQQVRDTLAQGAREGRITPAMAKGYEEFCLKGRDYFESFKANVLPNLPVIGEPAPRTPETQGGGSVEESFAIDEKDPSIIALRKRGYTDDQIKAGLRMIAQRGKDA